MSRLDELLDVPGFAFDVETTSDSGKKKDNLHHLKAKVRCIGFAYEKNGEIVSFAMSLEELNDNYGEIWQTFEHVMLSDRIKKIGHNIKFDAKVIATLLRSPIQGIFADTSILGKLLDENGDNSLGELSKRYLSEGKCGTYEEEDIEKLKKYCAKDAELAYRLCDKFQPLLEAQQLDKLFDIEMEVLRTFYRAELSGVPIDIPYLEKLKVKYQRQLDRIRSRMMKYLRSQNVTNVTIGKKVKGEQKWEIIQIEDININSPAQLTHLLYTELKYPALEQTDSGADSTNVKTLTKLSRQGYRFADWLLVYRHWEMLIRHIEKLLEEKIDDRIYCTFNTYGTETGRFSCSNPNLQQIPSKTTESIAIRKAFVGPYYVADYSNVELRLLAHYTRDPKLLSVYRTGGSGDLHSLTAESLGISRKHAKTINFGICYGMGWNKLADDLGIDVELAKEYINKWYKTYSRVQPWKDMIIATMKKYGFVRSIGGRKRRISFAGVSKYKAFELERETVNFVIQGSSADITKKAVAVLNKQGYDIRLQVHDELVISYNKWQKESQIENIRTQMENVVNLIVPLTVDIKECATWSEMKE